MSKKYSKGSISSGLSKTPMIRQCSEYDHQHDKLDRGESMRLFMHNKYI